MRSTKRGACWCPEAVCCFRPRIWPRGTTVCCSHWALYTVISSGCTYTQFLRTPCKYLRLFRSTDLVVEVGNGMPFLVPLWRRGLSLCLVNLVHTEQWDQFFNLVISEAGVRGTPVVGFDVRGVRDAIVDGETACWQLTPISSPAIGSGLPETVPCLRIAMGEAALKLSSGSPWELTVDAFAKVAEEAVFRHKRRRLRVSAP